MMELLCSSLRELPFIVYESDSIPEGSDVSLAADWISQLRLTVTRTPTERFPNHPTT